ncbi:modulator of smoothened protein-like [Corticium candelabrum]|uniref:modulator of smoothened protein-like n=1 Tax=Corticium candelabrum TaxID=121492 RepID=UPI002E32ECD3|nr:modulator of smoothened protein-like [Corticium candelabrum]
MLDKFVAVGAAFFFCANAFAIAAVASPWWIIYKPRENRAGVNKYGLTVSCRQDPDGHREWCGYVDVPGEWTATLVLLVVGIVCMCVTTFLLVLSLYKNELLGKAQKVAFAGMVLFCMAALVFPVGFYFEEIGGTPYKLMPSTSKVGTSYVLFVMAIFFTIIGELFACRVCAPMF